MKILKTLQILKPLELQFLMKNLKKLFMELASLSIRQWMEKQMLIQTQIQKDNIPIKFCVKRRFQEQSVSTSVEMPESHQAKRLKKVTFDTLVSLGLAEAEASNPDGSANPDGSTNPDGSANPDALITPDVSAGAANIVIVDESFPSPAEPPRRYVDYSWEAMQRIDQQLQHDRMSESEKKRKAERDQHEVKVYKKQKTKRNLAAAMDTQEPGAQSESDVHKAQTANTDAIYQGANHDKAANPDEATNPDEAAIPDKESNPDDSSAALVATQEPLTQSVKEGQATQEPPTQRAGESLTEAGSGKLSHFTSFTTIMSARMTTSEPLQEEPSTSMTSENLSLNSLPPLVSSHNCELSLSSENMRKDLEKNKNNERQSPVLAKGEVEMRKNLCIMIRMHKFLVR